jgi:HEPN domain-containing protein
LVERSADWLAQAKRDLENAKYEMNGKFFEWACFLCQQSAEKAVKAVFQKIGAEAYGHSVAGLLASLPRSKGEKKKSKERSGLVGLAKELDKAYISARYPNSHPEGAPYSVYTEIEALRFIENATKILKYCEDKLSEI